MKFLEYKSMEAPAEVAVEAPAVDAAPPDAASVEDAEEAHAGDAPPPDAPPVEAAEEAPADDAADGAAQV